MLVDSRLNGGRGSELAGLMCTPDLEASFAGAAGTFAYLERDSGSGVPSLVSKFCSVPINLRWKLAMLSQMDYGNLRSIAFSRKCRDFVSSGGLLAIKVRFLTKLIFHAQPRCTF